MYQRSPIQRRQLLWLFAFGNGNWIDLQPRKLWSISWWKQAWKDTVILGT